MIEYLPLEQCQKGHLYKLQSRNLRTGVFDGKDGFIGIRNKFDGDRLETEYHWDKGPPHGTARPLEDLGEIPSDLQVVERFSPVEEGTNREVYFGASALPGEKNHWRYCDTGEPAAPGCRILSRINLKLLQWLDQGGRRQYNQQLLLKIQEQLGASTADAKLLLFTAIQVLRALASAEPGWCIESERIEQVLQQVLEVPPS